MNDIYYIYDNINNIEVKNIWQQIIIKNKFKTIIIFIKE